MDVTYVVGCHWGDEGKGRVAFFESANSDLIVRSTGGNNAGHTVVYKGVKYPLHLVPSAIINPEKKCMIGPAVLVDPAVLIEEMEMLSKTVDITPDRLKISGRCHMILPYHKALDQLHEQNKGAGKVGTTGRGIGPCESDKRNRIGIRLYDLRLPKDELVSKIHTAVNIHNILFNDFGMDQFNAEELADLCYTYAEKLLPFICDTDEVLAESNECNQRILIEGAQAYRLDLEHGDYPNVTSTSPNGSGTLSGAGIGPVYATRGIGVIKAHCSRVGNGPFPTELCNEQGDVIRELAHEYGTTTGRPRRCGWLDLVILRSAKITMGLTELCLNHVDTMGMLGKELGTIKICVAYDYCGKRIRYFPDDMEVTHEIPKPVYIEFEGGWDTEGCKTYYDLPAKAKDFIDTIEREVDLPITYIGIGADNEATIVR